MLKSITPRKNIAFSSLLFLCLSHVCFGQEKPPIPLEVMWASGDLFPESVRGVNWMKDGAFYSTLEENKVVKYNINTGEQVEILFDGEKANLSITDYSISASGKKLLLQTDFAPIYRRSFTANYHVAEVGSQKAEALDTSSNQSYATFSPDEKKVAWTSGNNLFMKDLSSGTILQITKDGKANEIINGSSDWVYEEEFSVTKMFVWSPDSRRIAFLKFDESEVPEYNMQVWGSLYPEDYRFKYPKAGDKNSTVRLFVHDFKDGSQKELEIGAANDQYIPRIYWTKDPEVVSVMRMNRLQNRLELMHIHAQTGKIKIPYIEKSDTYIDIPEAFAYLEDGKRFLISSEKDGYRHLYLRNIDNFMEEQITKGNWEVTDFHGLNESTNMLYYTSTEVSSIERHLYTIRLDGKKKKQLTSEPGTHEINLSKSYDYFLDYYSTAQMPTKVTLKETSKGKTKRVVLENNRVQTNLDKYYTGQVEFGEIETDQEYSINFYMIKPQNFDPNKKYPVLMFVYGGPGSQEVQNHWLGHNALWFQHLAAKGYVVFCSDGRGTGGRGAEYKKSTYADLGNLELRDQILAAKWLQEKSFVDQDRIGIWGWSFGGYMTALAMTKGNGLFKMGISVAPVTNWRFYDTIYTERFLKLPKDNASGYDDNSPIFFADGLKGEYLLIHGTGDDNVHVQNSIEFIDALILANKEFETFFYPNRNHGIYGGITRYHLFKKMTDFVEENL